MQLKYNHILFSPVSRAVGGGHARLFTSPGALEGRKEKRLGPYYFPCEYRDQLELLLTLSLLLTLLLSKSHILMAERYNYYY